MKSIRLRLLLFLLGLSTLAWAAVTGSIWMQTVTEVEEIYDAHLEQAAGELLMLFAHEYEERLESDQSMADMANESDELEHYAAGSEYAPKLALRIWTDGKLVLHTPDAPELPVPVPGRFEDAVVGSERWRLYAVHDDEYDVMVQVAERFTIRDSVVAEVAAAAIYPALVAFPLLALLTWIAVGRGLRPLRRLAAQVRARSPDSLDAVGTADSPTEALPLVAALNGLLRRLGDTLERERRFTADASHELRTPLASLTVQAQVAQRSEDPEERDRALAQIRAGADRAAHLVEQLLTLARLDPEQAARQGGTQVAMGHLAAETVSRAYAAARAKDIDLALDTHGEDGLDGRPEALSVLLRNLVDNAIRYTPHGGSVNVAVRSGEGEVLLQVADSGPGIPPEQRPRVFDRFYRALGSGEEGCGLGLSIVGRIADLHRARIELGDSPLGGLLVTVRFPVRPEPDCPDTRDAKR